MNESSILGKRLLVVTAHPDDESFAAAGTIYKNNKAGGVTALICATRGEAGSSHLDEPLTETELGALREKELRQAVALLNIAQSYCLDFPDTKLRELEDRFQSQAMKIAQDFAPEVILGFAPDGLSGHLDHIVAGREAVSVAKELGVPMFGFGIDPNIVNDLEARQKQKRRYGIYEKEIKHQAPDFYVEIDPQIKRQAIRIHKSQFGLEMEDLPWPEDITKSIMQREYFVRLV